MGRDRKLTKHVLLRALQTNGSVAEAARYLGVDRSTIGRSLKHFGLDKAALKGGIAAGLSGFAAASAPISTNDAATSEAVEKAERTFAKLTASDFSGPYRGDLGCSAFLGTAEKQLARYRTLKG